MSAYWDLEASAGAVGASILWRGEWSGASSYNPYDAVSRTGSSYVSKTNNVNIDPATDGGTNWSVLAQGSIGPPGPSGPTGIARGYLSGFTLSNNVADAVNDIDIAIGECRDYTNVTDMVTVAALTKRLDAAWVVGNNQGGRDTGAIANGTYHVFVIKRSDTGVVDVLFSASPTAPTLPSGYAYFRRVGSIIRSAGTILAFTQTGDYFQWVAPTLDVNVTNLGTTPVSYPVAIPTGFKFQCRLNVVMSHATFAILNLRDPDTTDVAPNTASGSLENLHNHVSGAPVSGQFSLLSNTSGQIGARSNVASTTLRISTIGWTDTRDKPSSGGIVEVIGTGVTGLPRNYLSGFTLSNNATDAVNDIDIAVGSCRDSANVADITFTSSFTKRLDAIWAVGTNQGGLDAGTATDTTYHVFAIGRSDTGVVDVLFSTSAAAPTLPAGYTHFRRLGSILRVAGAIVLFTQKGDEFLRNVPSGDINASNSGTTAVLYALSVPTGIQVSAVVNLFLLNNSTNCNCIISSPDVPDTIPSASNFSLSQSAGNGSTGNVIVRTNTSAQIRSRTTVASVIEGSTIGWIDTRDKPSGGGVVEVIGTGTTGLPRNYLTGFTLSNNVTDIVNDIDISTGTCRDSGNTADITFTSAFTKRLDANWAVGTNQGGLDTGAIANACYHVFAIGRSDTGVVDALFSLSPTAPTLPASYTHFRRIGSVIRAAAAILLFSQEDDEFLWKNVVPDVNTSSQSTTAILYTLTVPTGIKVRAYFGTAAYNVGTAINHVIYYSSPDQLDDLAYGSGIGNTANTAYNIESFRIRTNTSAQIRVKASTAMASFALNTMGFIDRRGKGD